MHAALMMAAFQHMLPCQSALQCIAQTVLFSAGAQGEEAQQGAGSQAAAQRQQVKEHIDAQLCSPL